MNRICRILALMMTIILAMSIPFGFAEEEQVIELSAEQIAELTAVPEEAITEPTIEEADEATVEPTAEATVEPTAEPTAEPIAEPTVEPTIEATVEPTAEATVEPTIEATVEPTVEPTAEPTVEPTAEPTAEPVEDKETIILTGDERLVVGKSGTLKAGDADGKSISAKTLTWTTGDKSIATVSTKGKVTAKKQGTVTITATAKDGSFGRIEIRVIPKVTSVRICCNDIPADKSYGVDIDETPSLRLGVDVLPLEASDAVTWKSSSSKIAGVDADGNVTIRKAGTVTITATAKDGSKKKASLQLKIGRLVKEIEITGAWELTAGKSTTLKAVVSPSNASSKAVTWTSSDPSVAGVSSSGKVTAKKDKAGYDVWITATAKDGSGVTAKRKLIIGAAPESVKINLDGMSTGSATAVVDSTLQLDTQVLPVEAAQSVKWTSSNKKVATVEYGLVTALKAGTTTITATTDNGKKATLKLTVTKVEPVTTFEYTISDGECTITKYVGSAAKVVIPSRIEGCPVTAIGEGAFAWCESLQSVVIPDGVTSIGFEAFFYCESLQNVSIPSSVTSIEGHAFALCESLQSVTIPKGVTAISEYALYDCASLKSITIPDGVTEIGQFAFFQCSSLKSITIPHNVTSIGGNAFSACKSLKSINVASGNKAFSSVDGVLFNKEQTILIRFPNGKTATKYVIPEGVTAIDDRAFDECGSLKSVTIPGSVTGIGEYSFANCDNLTIYGRSSSAAEAFAKKEGIPFKLTGA